LTTAAPLCILKDMYYKSKQLNQYFKIIKRQVNSIHQEENLEKDFFHATLVGFNHILLK
jgi:hypothetical protein